MPSKKVYLPLDTVSNPTFSKRQLFFRSCLNISIIGVAIFTMIALVYDYLPMDIAITRYLQDLQIGWLDMWFEFVTQLGNYPTVVVVFLLPILFLLFLKRSKDALFITVSTLGIGLVSEILKALVARPRPSLDLIEHTIPNLPPGSFPSGHVLFFCGFFGSILFLTYTRLRKSLFRDFLMLVLFLLILSVGFSRVYLGAHWASDVTGSYFLGFIWLYLMSFIYRYLNIK